MEPENNIKGKENNGGSSQKKIKFSLYLICPATATIQIVLFCRAREKEHQEAEDVLAKLRKVEGEKTY